MGKGNIPDSVWLDPKTGQEPKTPAEFAAQQKRVEKWLQDKIDKEEGNR
jgi:hypothetical protein